MGLAYIALCDWTRNLVPIGCLTQIRSDLVIGVFPPLTSNARLISAQPYFNHYLRMLQLSLGGKCCFFLL